MPIRWATTNGNWSNLAIWNDSASLGFPTASDDIWSNNNNINIDQSFEVISLNNTARARTIATPAMTANNTPSPFVVMANNEGNGAAWLAFNRVTNVSGWYTNGFSTSAFISFDFGSGSSVVIDGYTIFGLSTQAINPRIWTLDGSNNNSTWTTVHSVSLGSAIGSSGTYSVASIGNTLGYRYYRVNITANGGSSIGTGMNELELYQPGTAALASGGSFIFNSGSISGSCTSTTSALIAGATNLIQVTATTGSVTLNLSSNVSGQIAGNLFLHSGNCNLTLNGQNFNGGGTNMVCINKSSAGTITVVGNIFAGNASGATGLNSTNGNTIVFGNLTGGSAQTIAQTLGNLTITGNVAGGAGIACITLSGASSQFIVVGNVTGGSFNTNGLGIAHSGTSGSIIGNVTGGSAAAGISTSGVLTVTGNVTGGTATAAHGINTTGPVTVTGNLLGNTGAGLAISNNATVIGNVTAGSTGVGLGTTTSTPSLTVTVTGTVAASSTIGGITIGGGTGNQVVNLSGNMLNVGGRQAIHSQNLFISNTTTSQWRLFTPGSQNKTLYSADTFPNLPSSSNVRSGSLFGPSNTLSGSMIIPSSSDVRINVPVDNTVGTATSLTAADFLNEISSSTNPVAVRFQNIATDSTVGSLLTGFNNGGF